MPTFVLIRAPTHSAELTSAMIWEQPGVLGIEELPADGQALFRPDLDHHFVRFDDRARYEEWLRADGFRRGDVVLLKVYLADDTAFPHDFEIVGRGTVEPYDYLAAMRAQHRGRVIDRFWVGPPWETPPAGQLPVLIEPGTAFGLGDHPTTQMCLELLAGIENARRIFDIGTGTGILAIAATKLFPNAEVWLSDLDPQCQSNVEHNFRLNGLPSPIHQVYGEQPLPPGPFDLTLSNLYLEALKSLIPVAATRWIVSGLLGEEQLAEFRRHASSWRIVRQLQREDWFALELRR